MTKSNNLNLAAFSACVGTVFQLRQQGIEPLDFTLLKATALPVGRGVALGRPEPFSLEFHSVGERHAPQGSYSFQNEQMGAIELFLVPVGRENGGVLYEAIFN